MIQTIIVKQYANQSAALRFCDRKSHVLDQFGEGANLAVNQIDAGVYQVQLIGHFGKEIDLSILFD